MPPTRVYENTKSIALSATLPSANALDALIEAGSGHVVLDGAGLATFEVTAVNGLTGTIEVLTSPTGTWRKWDSTQRAASGQPRLRSAGVVITLVAGDVLTVCDLYGFYAVRFKRTGGTSATLQIRTGEMYANAGIFALETYHFIPDGTDELLISASARRFYGMRAGTIDATPVYHRVYDKATAPAESDTPFDTLMVPANSTATLASGNNAGPFGNFVALTNGLGIRSVTGIAVDNDSAVTAAENIVTVYYTT